MDEYLAKLKTELLAAIKAGQRARFHDPLLGLPADPNRWSDDQTLLVAVGTPVT